MKTHPHMSAAFQQRSLLVAVLLSQSASIVHAENLSFDGIQASATTSHVINATDWAEYLGGNGTFAGANSGGRLYWRGSAGDGQYMHFDLSSLSGLTVVTPAFVTLQRSNATHGGGVDGSFVATANSSWTAGGGQAVPGATAVASAVNATGTYGGSVNGSAMSWGIGSSPLQSLVGSPGYHGLAVIGGSGSTLHFDNSLAPYLTVKTGTLSGSNVTGLITVSGGGAWNASNYSFVAGDSYSAAGSLRINNAVAGGTSGAGALTINGGNVLVNQAGGVDNAYWAIDSTTINSGGTLTINGHSHIHNLTLAGGELGSTGVNGQYGGWSFDDATTVTGGTTSIISARQINLDNGNITVDSGSTLNFSGTIRAGAITKHGGGSLILGGGNSHTGATTVTGGTISLSTTTSLGAWGSHPLTIYGGGKIESNWGTSNYNDLGALNLGASGQTGGELASLQAGVWNLGNYVLYGDVTVSGTSKSIISADVRVIYDQTRVFNVGSTGDPSGTDLLISGKIGHFDYNSWGYLEKTGPGTMKINGQSAIGGITVSAGKLILEDTGADWSVNNSGLTNNAQVEISVPSGSRTLQVPMYGGGTLVKSGDGTATLTGNNSFSGGTTINDGTLVATRSRLGTGAVVINSGGTLYANDQWVLCAPNEYGVAERNIGTLTINAGGTLHLDPISGFANGVANLNINGGSVIGGNNSDGRGALFLWNGNEQITAGGATTSSISVSIGLTGNNNTITVGTGSTLNLSGGFKNSDWYGGGFTGGFIKAGAGTMILSGGSTYSGTTTINDGQVIAQNGNAIGDLSNVTLNNSSQLRLDANESVGSLAGSATSSVNIQGNTLQLGSQVGSATATYDGVISGTGALVRRGSGTQTLTGNNSFSGSVTVRDGGTLSVPTATASGNQPLGTGTGNITLDGAGAGATLAITGSGTYNLPSSRGLALSGTGGILSVTAGTVNMAGSITGSSNSAHFTKAGSGTFNFSGSGPWTGDFNISGGTFNLTGGGAISGVGVTTVSGALNINTTGSMKTASLDILSGGAVSLDAGTLRVGGGGLGPSGRSIDNAGGSFTWGNGTLSVYTTGSGEAGLTDRANLGGSPSGPEVKEGNYLSVTGDLTAASGSTLDLGSTYLSNGLRYNQLNVEGNLTLNNASLNISMSPYFLRPNTPDSVFVGDWGTMVLAYAEGTLSGTFAQLGGKTLIPGISSDGIGWTQMADVAYTGGGSPFDPSSLGMNQWLIEYRDGSGGNGFNFTQSPGAAVLLHYKVAGSVPEPASAGLLVAGALLLRALRRRT